MPTYDYRCETCGKVFDKHVPLAGRDDVSCPECGTKPVKRLLTGGNFMKGTGCYSQGNCSPGCCGGGFSCSH